MAVSAVRQLAGPDACVLAVDVSQEARTLAMRLGASEATTPEDAREAVQRHSPPSRSGCSGIIEASGNEMLEVALACLADEGALSCVASQYGTRPSGGRRGDEPLAELPVPLDVLAERALRVSFTHGHAKQLLPHALDVAAAAAHAGSRGASNSSHLVSLRAAVSHRLSLDEAHEAYAIALENAGATGRVLVYPGMTEVRQVGHALAMYSQLD